jgi:hypothetical protein
MYLEALGDLTSDQIEYGCMMAGRVAEQFPKPGHIRSKAESCESSEWVGNGPRQLQYTEKMTAQEREEALGQCADLRKKLAPVAKIPRPISVQQVRKTKKQQLQEMKDHGWLAEK